VGKSHLEKVNKHPSAQASREIAEDQDHGHTNGSPEEDGFEQSQMALGVRAIPVMKRVKKSDGR
jgi:hypothetical protein